MKVQLDEHEIGHHTDIPGYQRFEREDVVQVISDGNEILATITRNFYGCLVLNTQSVMFVDVDLAPRLNRNNRDTDSAGINQLPTVERLRRDALEERFQEVSASKYMLGLRVYRTAAGFRLIVTDREYGALEPVTESIFTALGADPVYVSLCQEQECFRARLTPKPWRVGMETRYYHLQPEEQDAWRYRYELQAENYGVCEYITSLGNPRIINDSVNAIIEVHDRLTTKGGAMLA
jgi:hypothetical protein